MKVSERETRHLSAFRRSWLFNLPQIDWSGDLIAIHRVTEPILRHLAHDKRLMAELIDGAEQDEYLWEKCEEDVVEDKIVLWDDIEKNIRIRLRMSTQPQQRLAHSHRFSFSNLVLKGRYLHWGYRELPTFDENTRLDDVEEVYIHEDRAGDCFTIHSECLHSTPFAQENTISLVLRGNPIKRRAPVMFKEARGRAEAIARRALEGEPRAAAAGQLFWRVGEDEEAPAVRAERRMTRERLGEWRVRLREFGLIS